VFFLGFSFFGTKGLPVLPAMGDSTAAATAPRGLATRVMFNGDGDGKFGLMPLFRDEELDFLIGIRSCLCWRETEIWRAIEISAADLRRSSLSGSSLLGLATVLGTDMEGEANAVLETSDGRGRVAEEVVALRFRLVAGGGWIWTCLCIALCGIVAVEILDAEVDVELPSDRDEVDPDTEGGAWWICGAIICQFGSSSLGFMGNGVGS
jgi:hypothetical protein